ncbi:TPA: DUF1937 family protein, partial [Serratia marcescens]
MRKIFLACPYSHADANVVQQRFIAGNAVFSQVSMSHPINLCLQDLDKTAIGTLWAPIDALFMAAMDVLIVLDLPGWQESGGIKREMDSFAARGCRVSLWSEVA